MNAPRLILAFGALLQAGTAIAVQAPPDAVAESSAEAAASAAKARAEMADMRKQIGELSRRMAELSLELGDVGPQAYAFRYMNDPDRAMVGLVLSADPKGARIDAVTPQGPAARAGLHSGDILVSVNGESLAGKDAKISLGNAQKALKGLKPDQTVRLGYQRGGRETATVEVKAERREAWNWQTLFEGDTDMEAKVGRDQQRAMERHVEVIVEENGKEPDREAAGKRTLAWGTEGEGAHEDSRMNTMHYEFKHEAMPWWGINLTSLNADLGHYFGTDSGVLVLSASQEALPGIKAGDVIRKISGKSIDRPEQVLRTLRDEEAGKLVELAILRDRKPMTLNIKAPKYKALFSVAAPPAPPKPPKPPKPPAPVKPVDSPTPASPPAPPAPPAPPDPAPLSGDVAIF